jgi:hypothetical protein
MRDLTIRLEKLPGDLAEIGAALGAAGVSVEGSGAFLFGDKSIAHFLFEDGVAARKALETKGIEVLADREVLVQRLKQDQSEQLGKIADPLFKPFGAII